ncbi:type IV pilus modification protein PilV [Acinetobacter sp. HY1485]|uniref:type IV pilus modification protein PilV n=1 Tax=Acinetobacter sp. HY1485 TaxID=2970918 RepID=UPI0022B99282|nr:type IV pilus modification protein PilV [Acinetobacter sp. HY1485]
MIKQKGVGLIEILVVIFLLAVGVLGFVTLQYRAVTATAEATNRVQAISLARDLSEKIRINNSTTAIESYKTNLQSQSTQITTSYECYTNYCSPATKAQFDIHQTYVEASRLGMRIQMQTCPSTSNGRQCIYIAWDKTDPTNNTPTTTGNIACTKSTANSFSYNDDSTCVVMETY